MEFKWNKLGRVFKADGQYPWLNSHTTPAVTLLLKDRIRVYIGSRTKADQNGNFITNTTFIDLNRANPTEIIYVHDQPLFELGSFGAFDEFGIMVTDVTMVNDKVYLYYAGWQRLGGGTAAYQVMLGLAISTDDGYTFEKVGKGPIMGINQFDHISIGNVAVLKDLNEWRLYYTNLTEWILNGNKPTYEYEIKYASSADGINWNRSNNVLIGVGKNGGVATPTVHKIDNIYHMWFGYRKAYDDNNDIGGYGIGYAFSHDGINWTRDDLKSGILKSEKGWDSEMVCYPDLVKIDNKLLLFYCGNGFGKEGFGVAEMVLEP